MKTIKKLYFKLFKRYRRLEMKGFSYKEADALLRANTGKPESEQWHLAKEEDMNIFIGIMVFLERRERIVE